MADSASISDFKITVKMDTSGALKSLTHLNKRMEVFAKRLNELSKGIKGIKDDLVPPPDGSPKDPATRANKWKLALRGVKAVAGGVGKLFKGIGRVSGGILGTLWNWKYAIIGILGATTLLIAKMTKTGAKNQSAQIAMQAAVGISMKQGEDPAKLLKEQLAQTNYAKHLSLKYGFDQADTTSSYAKFYTAAAPQIGAENVQGFFTSFSKLATIFGLDREKVSRSMVAFQQMADKGQVMAEELKQQLAEQLPGAMIIFARAATKMGKYGKVDVDKLYKLMEQGLLKTKELLPLVGKEMDAVVEDSGALGAALNSVTVQLGVLNNKWQIFQEGAFNQFSDELTVLIKRLGNILAGKGFQTVVGVTIEGWLNSIIKATESTAKFFREFEKNWSKSSIEDKKKLLEDFWSVFTGFAFTEIGDSIVSAFNSITVEDFKPFTDTVGKAIGNAMGTGIGHMTGYTSAVATIKDFFTPGFGQRREDRLRGEAMGKRLDLYINSKVNLQLASEKVGLFSDYGVRHNIADVIYDDLINELKAITTNPLEGF